MASHSSILAWKIQWTEEPGGLQSMGSQRVEHNLATELPQQPSRNTHPDYGDRHVSSLTFTLFLLDTLLLRIKKSGPAAQAGS